MPDSQRTESLAASNFDEAASQRRQRAVELPILVETLETLERVRVGQKNRRVCARVKRAECQKPNVGVESC